MRALMQIIALFPWIRLRSSTTSMCDHKKTSISRRPSCLKSTAQEQSYTMLRIRTPRSPAATRQTRQKDVFPPETNKHNSRETTAQYHARATNPMPFAGNTTILKCKQQSSPASRRSNLNLRINSFESFSPHALDLHGSRCLQTTNILLDIILSKFLSEAV